MIKISAQIISFCLVFGILTSKVAKAQDPLFSLFESTAINFNPAHTGNQDFMRASIGYRNQYPTYKSPFTTYLASYDTYVESINSGFGIMLMNDKVEKGVFTTTSISLAYSHNIRISSNLYARAGLSASYFNRQRNPNKLIFPDMINFDGSIIGGSNYPIINDNALYVGFGVSFLYKNLKVGGALLNFEGKNWSQHDKIKIASPKKATAFLAFDIPLSTGNARNWQSNQAASTVISPFIRYMRQYKFEDIDIGAYFNTNVFFLGLSHRSDSKFKNTTFVVAAGINAGLFNIAYSANFGNLGKSRRYISSHEINLSIKLKDLRQDTDRHNINPYYNNNNNKRYRVYKCPYFFSQK